MSWPIYLPVTLVGPRPDCDVMLEPDTMPSGYEQDQSSPEHLLVFSLVRVKLCLLFGLAILN